MSDSGDQVANDHKGMRGLQIAYCFRFGIGVFMIILAFVAIGFYVEMTTRGVPYFLGALLTGIAMVCLSVFNFRYWRNYTRGNATYNQQTLSLRIEIGISATALILGLFGIITVSVNGVQTPECHSLLGSCSLQAYKSSNNFKLAVVLLLMLILSIVSNIVCSVIHWRTSKSEGIHIFKFKRERFPENRHRSAPIQADISTGFVLNTRHGQPQAFQGAVLSRPGGSFQAGYQESPIVLNTRYGQPEPFGGAIISYPPGPNTEHHSTNQAGFQDGPIVLNTRHGQPEAFGGAILSRPGGPSTGHHQTNVTHVGIEERPIVLNYRHGQPEPYEGAILSRPGNNDNVAGQQQPLLQRNNNSRDQGSTGFVLDTHHGQPRPFAGAVLSTNTQRPTPQHDERNVPSKSSSDSPPSYETCLKDPSRVQYLEERGRKDRSPQHSPLNPSAPPL